MKEADEKIASWGKTPEWELPGFEEKLKKREEIYAKRITDWTEKYHVDKTGRAKEEKIDAQELKDHKFEKASIAPEEGEIKAKKEEIEDKIS